MPASADPPAASTRLTVDGEDFEVTELAPGEYGFAWLSGPNPGYGFVIATTPRGPLDPGRWEGEIRGFLAEVDPESGYLE